MVAAIGAVSPCGMGREIRDACVDGESDQRRPEEWPREDRRRSRVARAARATGRGLRSVVIWVACAYAWAAAVGLLLLLLEGAAALLWLLVVLMV